MNHEIKFRGQRVDGGGWVYGDLINTPNDDISVQFIQIDKFATHDERVGYYNDGYSMKLLNNSVPVIPETVGQYTGLKDKNGVEIYEGDIVAFEDCTSTESGYYEQNCVGEVLWDLETVSFCVSNRLMAESYEVLEECLVIGNIHDNPELVEVQNERN